jgi:eukaryotic-like serine/threonine-protein kinase
VAQIGDGPEPQGNVPHVLTFGAPTVGEILAERYQLEDHIGTDSLGRQLWRGVDVVLRRPVAVVLRYPGGDSASEMLAAAVAASRIVHPHLAGVYDAIDEGERAYVVREWVDGFSLRELVADNALEPDRATMIGAAVSDAVAAVHATGMAHGNIHPGTVLVASDGRVVVTDARSDEAATPESDLRSIGGVLYCALTARWPHAEAGPTAIDDAVRDGNGALAAPRQMRGGVPTFLDELTMDLLNPAMTPPSAEVLVGELSRFEEQDGGHGLFAGPQATLGFDTFDHTTVPAEPPRRAGRKIALGVAGLLVIALVGIFGAAQALSSGGGSGSKAASTATNSAAAQRTGAPGAPVPLTLHGDQVRIVDPPNGDRTELEHADRTVDGDTKTGWSTQQYRPPAEFGGYKPGMGVLINLGSPRKVTSVKVLLSAPGATVSLRAGDSDPGSSGDGDGKVAKDFVVVGDEHADAPATLILPGAPDKPTQYLLVWISKLPADGKGGFQIGIQEITVSVE